MADQEVLPIDVNYQKLAEWLVQRQKLPQDWHKMVHAIQAKMAEAVKQLPAGFLAKLELGQDAPLDYFAALQISRALDAQEGSRNMLGVRTGNAAVWEKVVKAYEKNLLFVGEACQTMIQNADHEIPYLRKQAARCDQLVSDGEKKQAELLKAAATCAAAFKEECSKLGIEGMQVRSELQKLVAKLPGMFLAVAEKLREPTVNQAVEYYQQFAAAVHDLPEGAANTTLTVLKQVINAKESDPAVVLQQGSSIPAPTPTSEPKTADIGGSAAPTGIDWDLDLSALAEATEGTTAAAPAGIDWDVSVDVPSTSDPAPAGIDWNVTLEPTAVEGAAVDIDWDVTADAAANDAGPAVDINWDVDVGGSGEDAGTAPAGIDWEVVTGETGDAAGTGATIDWDIDLADEGTGKAVDVDWDLGDTTGVEESAAGELSTAGADAAEGGTDREGAGASSSGEPHSTADVVQRLQQDPDFRANLLDDIQELKAFLVTRRSELQSQGADLFLALLPEALQHVDKERIGGMSSAVEAAEQLLLSDKLRQLLLIMTSPQYLDRLVRTLELKAGQESRLIASRKEVEAKRNESILSLRELQPKIQKLVTRTKTVKAAVEKALANQFAGRRINVLGEINVVLAHAG